MAESRAEKGAGSHPLESWIVGLVILAGALALIWLGDSDVPAPVGRGASAPGFRLERLDGEGPIALADFRGRVVLVNFWATWCAPCVAEMPQLDRLKKILAGDKIEFLAISEDRAGVPLVKKFYDLNRIRNLDIFIDKGRKVLSGSKVFGLPTTMLIDKRGREIGRALGAAEWDSSEAVTFLRQCLGS